MQNMFTRTAIMAAIGLTPTTKLAPDFSGDFPQVVVPEWHGVYCFRLDIRVIGLAWARFLKSPVPAKQPRRPHRILVRCPKCNLYVPFGRISQHLTMTHRGEIITW